MKRTVLLSVLLPMLVSAGTALLIISLVNPHRAEAQGQTIRAQAFQVVDESGKTRVALGPASTGSTGLWLIDQYGTTRVALILWEKDAPALIFSDVGHRPRAYLTLAESGWAALTFTDDANQAVWRAP